MIWTKLRICKPREVGICFQMTRPSSNLSEVGDSRSDEMTNVTPKIMGHLGRNLHLQPYHPLNLIKQRIANYMYARYKQHRDMPTFSLHEQISPVVRTEQNFDSLLVPPDHVSRRKIDSFHRTTASHA